MKLLKLIQININKRKRTFIFMTNLIIFIKNNTILRYKIMLFNLGLARLFNIKYYEPKINIFIISHQLTRYSNLI